MSDDDEIRWVSYAELAEARGIDRPSAIRIARMRRWPKQKANDGGIRVGVPRNFLEAKRRDPPEIPPETTRKIKALEAENAELREQVVELRVREGAALARAETLQAVVERLTASPFAGTWARLRDLIGGNRYRR